MKVPEPGDHREAARGDHHPRNREKRLREIEKFSSIRALETGKGINGPGLDELPNPGQVGRHQLEHEVGPLLNPHQVIRDDARKPPVRLEDHLRLEPGKQAHPHRSAAVAVIRVSADYGRRWPDEQAKQDYGDNGGFHEVLNLRGPSLYQGKDSGKKAKAKGQIRRMTWKKPVGVVRISAIQSSWSGPKTFRQFSLHIRPDPW